MIPLVLTVLSADPAWTQPNSREVAVFPFIARLGVGSTRQYGFAADLAWPLSEGIALTVRGQYDYAPLARDESNICLVVPCRADVRPDNTAGLMIAAAALLGFELTPASGAVTFYGRSAEVGLVISGGLGAASSRRQARFGETSSFVDTGWRFAAQFGGGFRFRIAQWITVRLELRGLFYSSTVDRVNGCSKADLKLLDTALRAGTFTRSEAIVPTCGIKADDVPIAYNMTRSPSGHLLESIQLHTGLGIAF